MDSRRLGAGGREGGGGLFCLGGRAALLGTGGVVRWAGGGDSRTGVASERCAARRTNGTAPGRDAQRGSALFPAVRHRPGLSPAVGDRRTPWQARNEPDAAPGPTCGSWLCATGNAIRREREVDPEDALQDRGSVSVVPLQIRAAE